MPKRATDAVPSDSDEDYQTKKKKWGSDSDDEGPASVKVFSNKTIDESKVPPKPAALATLGAPPKKKKETPFDFRLVFTNGILLRKFLEPAAHAVKKMRFSICHPEKLDEFHGFKIECHDQAFTLADRGLFECFVDSNVPNASGRCSADGITFCVSAEAFMDALMASTLKETNLQITRYTKDVDRLTFESINNDNDVRSVYHCNLMDTTQVDSLDGISIELGFHVNVHMATLKEMSLNAKRCGAPTLKFDLWQCTDPKDANILHSKMCIGFQGLNTSGVHDFFISLEKKTENGPDGPHIVWEPLKVNPGLDFVEELPLKKCCSNEYDNKKLRMFLNHMEAQWVLVHLCTDNSVQPLVLECKMGGSRTQHTLIVAPKEVGDTSS